MFPYSPNPIPHPRQLWRVDFERLSLGGTLRFHAAAAAILNHLPASVRLKASAPVLAMAVAADASDEVF